MIRALGSACSRTEPPYDPHRRLARIGYADPRAATLVVPRELHALHPRAIPFEDLDPLRLRRVAIDLPAVEAKLVDGRRDGYCFESHTLFAHVLLQPGFAVTPMLARVLRGRADGDAAPLTHMLQRVDVDGQAWLADVGFGAASLNAPLKLEAGAEQPSSRAADQPTSHETMRLARRRGDDAFDLEVHSEAARETAYRFAARRVERIDHELADW